MLWPPPYNGRQSLAKENLPVDTARQEKKRKTATIMEEPSDGLYEKQKSGRIEEMAEDRHIYIYIYIYIYNSYTDLLTCEAH